MIISAQILCAKWSWLIPMRRTSQALAVEPDEVPVISNELLEANIVSIRTDLTDLKVEFRTVVAVAAKMESESKSGFARIDEQFREVRQDIRELRADNKTLRDKIDATQASLSVRIDENHSSLDRKIDATQASLATKIDENYSSLDRKIDATQASLAAKIDENYSALDKKIDTEVGELRADVKEMQADIKEICVSVADLKGMQKAILWVVGGAGTLVAIVGVGFTIARTLRWI
jgi:DNA anti-recombination protein RmuC